MRLPPSTSKSLEMEGQILTTFYKQFNLLQIFKKEGGELSSKLKTRKAKTLLRLFSQSLATQKVMFSAKTWGVFIGLKMIQI